jgi:putative PIN family toxin of toxin-antitoxin system
VILDTNILVSALLVQSGPPGLIYRAWLEGSFQLLCCRLQMEELRATFRKPTLSSRIPAQQAGRMMNHLNRYAFMVDPLPRVVRSPDPTDDFLLGAAEAGQADCLVTGDKSGLLSLVRHGRTRIVAANKFATLLA